MPHDRTVNNYISSLIAARQEITDFVAKEYTRLNEYKKKSSFEKALACKDYPIIEKQLRRDFDLVFYYMVRDGGYYKQ